MQTVTLTQISTYLSESYATASLYCTGLEGDKFRVGKGFVRKFDRTETAAFISFLFAMKHGRSRANAAYTFRFFKNIVNDIRTPYEQMSLVYYIWLSPESKASGLREVNQAEGDLNGPAPEGIRFVPGKSLAVLYPCSLFFTMADEIFEMAKKEKKKAVAAATA